MAGFVDAVITAAGVLTDIDIVLHLFARLYLHRANPRGSRLHQYRAQPPV
jgi:hypothetical protein